MPRHIARLESISAWHAQCARARSLGHAEMIDPYLPVVTMRPGWSRMDTCTQALREALDVLPAGAPGEASQPDLELPERLDFGSEQGQRHPSIHVKAFFQGVITFKQF